MPHQYEEFVNTATSAGKDEMTFFVKPISSGSDWRSRVVNLEKPEDVKYIESRRLYYVYFLVVDTHSTQPVGFTNKVVSFSNTSTTNCSSRISHLVSEHLYWSLQCLHWEPTCTLKESFISGPINIKVTIEYVCVLYKCLYGYSSASRLQALIEQSEIFISSL